MKRKLLVTTIIILLVTLCFTGCFGKKQPPANEGIMGIWYEGSWGDVYVVVFYDDGTYLRVPEEYFDDPEQDYVGFTYEESTGILELESYDVPAIVTFGDDCMTYTFEDYDETYTVYRDREVAIANDPSYLLSDQFTDTIMDEDGFCIKDGVLYAYRGNAKEITVPEGVETIYMEAFAGDFDHGINLEKVTIPGSVKEIKSHAFAFTNADYIFIEEGVETIGDYAFMDSYVKEIHFPASLTNIGAAIMETEEGLEGAKIFVPANSPIEKHFKDNLPYGDVEMIAE